MAWRGLARRSRLGAAWLGVAVKVGLGPAGHGGAVKARLGMARRGGHGVVLGLLADAIRYVQTRSSPSAATKLGEMKSLGPSASLIA